MIHKSKVINGVVAYVDNEITAKMAGGWKAWVIGGAAGLAAAKADTLLEQLAQNPAIQALGIIEGENIDVDAICGELRKQARKGTATVNIPLVGAVTFGESDVESLYRYIKGA